MDSRQLRYFIAVYEQRNQHAVSNMSNVVIDMFVWISGS